MVKKLTSYRHSAGDADPIPTTAEEEKMENLEDLVKQQQELEEKIRAIRESKRQEVIASMKLQMKTYQISIADLMEDADLPKRRRTSPVSEKTSLVPAKYQDSAGNQWSGRGRSPRWIAESGLPKEHFLIK